ncbi:MAG: hypothetical protein MJE77_23375 [Proteobacteria bacterium]|nr:hypothetical protein [Pseudomonadota bacterium]
MLTRMAKKNNTQSKIAANLRELMGRQRITATACSTRGETRCRVMSRLNLVGKYKFAFAFCSVPSFWPPETSQDEEGNDELEVDDDYEPSYLATQLKKLALAYQKDPDRILTIMAEAAEGYESDIMLMLALIRGVLAELGFEPSRREGKNEESKQSGSGNDHAHGKSTESRPSDSDDEDNEKQA